MRKVFLQCSKCVSILFIFGIDCDQMKNFQQKKNPKLLQLSNGLNSFTYSVKCRIRTWCFIWKGCGLEWIMVKSDSMKWNIDGWPLDRRCVKIMIFIFANFMKRIFISHHSLTCCFTVLTSEIYQYHFIKMIKMIYMCLCVCVYVWCICYSLLFHSMLSGGNKEMRPVNKYNHIRNSTLTDSYTYIAQVRQ